MSTLEHTQSLITQALSKFSEAYPQIKELEIAPEVAFAANEKFGDVSTNVAMVLFAQLKQLGANAPQELSSPRAVAEAVVGVINEEISQSIGNGEQSIYQSVTIAGPGFINFTFFEDYLFAELDRVGEEKEGFGRNKNSGRNKPVVVEYSSPNIAKPFTVGHLRSTIIGDALANILEFTGYQVYRDNHLGDWGTQFGKLIYAIKTWGDMATIEASSRPVKDLVALYVQFHEEAEKDPDLDTQGRAWFKKLEEGDSSARDIWQKCIDWSLKEFSAIYELLGVSFTENEGKGYGESFFEDKMDQVIAELESKGLLQEGKEGAKLIFFENDVYPPLMILKGDGATLYATRDLATDKWRLSEYGSDVLVINEVGAEQELYWKQIFRTEELLGWYKPGQRVHVKHGHYRFKDGKMSTRKGNVIWLEDVIKEAIDRATHLTQQKGHLEFDRVASLHPEFAKQEMGYSEVKDAQEMRQEYSDTTKAIGVGALKWNDLKGSTHREIVFDWDEMLNMQGNSGPYIQYTYARAKSVLTKAEKSDVAHSKEQNRYPKLNEEERSILNHLWKFEYAVERAASEFAPHHVATYVYELAQRFNTFYNQHSILGEDVDEETKALRLAITSASAQVIKNALGLLGIEAPEKM